MSVKANVVGSLKFEYEQPKATQEIETGFKKNNPFKNISVGNLGSFTVTSHVNDMTISFKAVDSTFKNLHNLRGACFTLSKPYGSIRGQWKFANKKFVEVSGGWTEKSKAVVLSMTGCPHEAVRVTNRFTTKDNRLSSQVQLRHHGLVMSHSIDWNSLRMGLLMTQELNRSRTMIGSFDFVDKVVGLEYTFKPFKVILTGQIDGNNLLNKPKLSLTYANDFSLDAATKSRLAKDVQLLASHPRVGLESKLKEIDAMYDERLKAAQK